MRRLLGWIVRFGGLFNKHRNDRDLEDEIESHLQMHIEDNLRLGLSPQEAHRFALLKLGSVESTKEAYRDQRGMLVLEVLAQDLRYSLRMLWKTPAFTCISALSLALGIGANTALFSLVDDLVLRSLPVRDPDRLVHILQTSRALGIRKAGPFFSKPAFDYIRTRNQVLSESVSFNSLDSPEVSIDGVAYTSRHVQQVSENFFRDLGVAPILGRAPEPSDEAVAILSYRLWRDRFSGSPTVLGRILSVDGQAYSIIGVAPPRFAGLSVETSTELWVSSRTSASQQIVARLKPGVTSAQAQAAIEVAFHQFAQAQSDVVPGVAPMRIELLPAGKGLSQLRGQYEQSLLALDALAILLLLITCMNVGNLLVVRNTARKRELTVRWALGARRSRLIAQQLVESALLTGLGGILALVFARWGVSILLSMLPLPAIPNGLAFQTDLRVLGFMAGVSLLSALLFGLAPAWRATRVDLTAVLKSSQGTTASKSARRFGHSLIACQVGLSVILLAGAGLFVQTLRNLARLDMGFNPENLFQVSLDTRRSGYRQGQVGGCYRLLLERVSTIPGVRSVTGIRNGVAQGAFSRGVVAIPGRTFSRDEAWDQAQVGPSFFEAMGIAVLRGGTFSAADFAQNRRCVVVSEAFAKHYFPNEDPVGRRIGPSSEIEIIGVVRDAKLTSVRRESGPMMYFMAPGEPDRIGALEVRATGDPKAIARAVREEVQRVNPRLLVDLTTMQQEIDRNIAQERMLAATSAFFSLLGLLLVSIGIFGVASYTVTQRTNEFGIRMALGASRRSVIHESLRATMQVFGVGLAVGIVAALAAVRLTTSFISSLLFGLTATDPANIVGAAMLMVGVGLAACTLPAWRATKIDPLTAIRYE